MIKKNNGVLESPMARKMLDSRLYNMVAKIPLQIIKIYLAACSIISGGVCMASNNFRLNIILAIDRTLPIPKVIIKETPNDLFS